MMTARAGKEDDIWQLVIKTKVTGKLGYWAVCKKCNKEMQELVDRFKNHWKNCKDQLIENLNKSRLNIDKSEITAQSRPITKTGNQREFECWMWY